MTESTTIQPGLHEKPNINEMGNERSVEAYCAQLNELGKTIPEIEQKREALKNTGIEIVEEFGIGPDFFDDDGRSLVFTAISSRWATNKEREPGEDRDREQTFLADTIALIAYKHSDKLGEARKIIEEKGSPISKEMRQMVYDKYTDKEYSELMRKKIDDEGLLNKVKKRLGITAENEDPYEVRVLSINHSEHDQTYGLDAPMPNYELPSGSSILESDVRLQEAVKNWKDGLVKRGDTFASELGLDSLFAGAWVTTLNGKQILCISSALAEKLIDPKVTENTFWYTKNDQNRDLAILEHEYTHTQGGVNVDREVAFGINLEELRAEHYSGNTMGYQDIKGFFVDIAVATGFHPNEIFDQRKKGGSTVEVFGDIVRSIGMARMLEVVLASPKNYIEDQSNEFVQAVYEYLGGFDGIIKRLIDDQNAAGKGRGMEVRIIERAQKMAEIAGKDGKEWLWDYRRKDGLNVMTNLVNRSAEEQGLKKAA